MIDWAQALFAPRRVALVGASNTPGTVGERFMRNLSEGFPGEIYPVNPRAEAMILQHPAYRSLLETPERPDLAVLAVPATSTARVIEDCIQARVPVALLVGGGFAESGCEGAALQAAIVSLAREGDLRLVGPNSFGVINTARRLNASLGLGMPARGSVSLVTQSGAYAMAAFTRSQDGDSGFAKVIALGNKADIDEVEVLSCLGDDPETRVIALLLESVRNGRAFFEAARSITPRKPVIVLKTGRSQAARRASASHTAALANDYAVLESALKQAGVRVVRDGLSLLDLASTLALQPPLRGRRVAIITNSGGVGVELSDLLSEAGLEVPRLSAQIQRRLQALVPPHGSVENPVDVTTDWSRFAEGYGGALSLLLGSAEIDAVMPVLLQRSALMPEVSGAVAAAVRQAWESGSDKPVHACWVAGPEAAANRAHLLSAGIPCHEWPARAAAALAASMTLPVFASEIAPVRETRNDYQCHCDEDGWLSLSACFTLLAARGFPVTPWKPVASSHEASAAAEGMGFPVVLKAAASSGRHKSESGAVRLDLKHPEDLLEAFEALREISGAGELLVQPRVAAGPELLLGMVRDPAFGPVVMVGLGGIHAEAVRDVSMRLAPVGADEARCMISELRGQRLLAGYRGAPAVDRDALAELVAGFSRWAAGAEWLREVDLNPVIANRSGLHIVDARIRAMPVPDGETRCR